MRRGAAFLVAGEAGAGVAFAAGRFLRDIGLMGVGIADLCDVFASTFAAEARARAKDTSVTCRAIAIFLAALLARDGGGASPKADPQGHQAPERQVSLRFCVHGVFLDRCSCSNFVCTLVLSQAQQVRSERFGGGGPVWFSAAAGVCISRLCRAEAWLWGRISRSCL